MSRQKVTLTRRGAGTLDYQQITKRQDYHESTVFENLLHTPPNEYIAMSYSFDILSVEQCAYIGW